MIAFLFLSILDDEDACSQKDDDKSVTYFQIKDANGYVLELKENSDLSPLPDDSQEVSFLWYYCSFICCWYRFLSYIQVLFWLSNANFKFPMFSFSWFHRPIKDCLSSYRKIKYVRLLKINESSFWHVSYSKFGFFGKKLLFLEKTLKLITFCLA